MDLLLASACFRFACVYRISTWRTPNANPVRGRSRRASDLGLANPKRENEPPLARAWTESAFRVPEMPISAIVRPHVTRPPLACSKSRFGERTIGLQVVLSLRKSRFLPRVMPRH